ncbi:MAG: ferrous iron transport protein A [Methanomicrobium sp.]|nr:ferrous iron transport protein A [Methanomicrobium sp.]MBO4522325.1 ferrous iron transport protein A [Methanomicrobium sp.]
MSESQPARNTKKEQVMPLAFMKQGECGVVNAVHLGDDVRKKLITLGICQNSEVRVCSESCGSVIVSVGSAHYALSRPTAMKIMVGIGSMGGTDGRDCNIDSASSAAHAAESVVAVDFDTAAVVPQKHTGKISELNEIKKAVGTV